MAFKLGKERIKAINDGGLSLTSKAKFKNLPRHAQKQLKDTYMPPVFSIEVSIFLTTTF